VGGALAVTLQTTASGLTDLPFNRFALLMIPVHAAIGVAEGLITIAVLEQLPAWAQDQGAPQPREGRRVAGVALTALVVAGLVSWLASARPDGLEYSVARMGVEPASLRGGLNQRLRQWQSQHALLPNSDFKPTPVASSGVASAMAGAAPAQPWPKVNAGTSVAGLGGAVVVALLALGLGGLASWWARRRARA